MAPFLLVTKSSPPSGGLTKSDDCVGVAHSAEHKEEGARAKKLVTCGTRGPLGRGQSVPFSAQGAYCSAPEP